MSKNDRFELSRRKALAGIGGIGVASAGAGLGTSAYFSDQEEFTDNSITAGQLDLRLDWEEHYYDESAGDEYVQILGEDEEAGDDIEHVFRFPNGDTRRLGVTDLDAFMDATAIEAYPDAADDGIQDDLSEYDPCEDFADLPEDLDPEGFRSDNEDTRDENDEPAPLISLDDVKPGDFGEVTFSLHLCDNPGYIWMNGEVVDNDQNGTTEPEEKVLMDEFGEIPDEGQLADELMVRLWYDENCNNVYEPRGEEVEGEELDVSLVLDVSGSMGRSINGQTRLEAAQNGSKTLVDALDDSDQASLVTFSSSAQRPFDLTPMDATGKDDIKDEIDGLDDGGLTNMEGGVIYGTEEVLGDEDIWPGVDTDPSSNARSNAQKAMVVLADGAANRTETGGDATQAAIDAAEEADDRGVRVFTVAIGEADPDTMEQMASSSEDFYEAENIDELEDVFADIGEVIREGEELIFEGPFTDAMAELESDDGLLLDGRPDTEETACFVNSVTKCIGFEWWLPTSVGNEVQTDRLAFNLGFYTEQCRHNEVET